MPKLNRFYVRRAPNPDWWLVIDREETNEYAMGPEPQQSRRAARELAKKLEEEFAK